MQSSTLIILLTVFLVALSFSVKVAEAGEEKGKEGKEKGGEEGKKEGEEGGEGEEGEGKEEKKGESGAMSFISSNGLSTALSLVIASVFFSFP